MNMELLHKKDPKERDVMILQALASGQYAFGQYNTALDLLHLALTIDSLNAETHVLTSRVHYALGDWANAKKSIADAATYTLDGLTERDQVFERRIRLLDELTNQQRFVV